MRRARWIDNAEPAAWRRARRRRGATMIETALVLMVFLTMVFGMFDLGLAVFRYNLVSQGARNLARQAIVHGEMAPPRRSQWGPATYVGSADGSDEVAAAVRSTLGGLDLERTTLRLEWLDGSSAPEQRVRATVTTQHSPFVTFIFGNPTWTLSGSSTMLIAH